MALNSILPCVMYNNQAEQAADFYVSVFSEVFGDAAIQHTGRWGAEEMKAMERLAPEDRPFKIGDVSTVRLRLNGTELLLGNGGPHFKFNDAVSLYVICEDQAQLDALWSKLTSGDGHEVECGWLNDKFGLRWQVTAKAVERMREDKDPDKASRATAAILNMKKIDVAAVEKAFRGG